MQVCFYKYLTIFYNKALEAFFVLIYSNNMIFLAYRRNRSPKIGLYKPNRLLKTTMSVRDKLKITYVLVLVNSFLVSGCATLSINDFFNGYAEQLTPAKNAIAAGNAKQAEQLLPKRSTSNNAYTLNLLEKGRVSFINQDYQESKSWFEQAYQQLEKDRAKAKLQLSRGINNVSAMVSNDNAIGYQVPAYEQSMLHTYQALNFIFSEQLESALVEVRRANQVQSLALADYEKEIYEANKELKEVGQTSWSQSPLHKGLSAQANSVKNSIQNAYTFYLSGLLYEADSQLNDAYIDYKKALEIFPDNRYVQQDVYRLAVKLNMTQDLPKLKESYGSFEQQSSNDTGQVVFIVEQGLIESRQELRLNLPISTRHGDFRTFNLALPGYSNRSNYGAEISASIDGETLNAQPIVKLQALAAKQLEEKMPAMIARQTLRLIAKEQVRRKLSKENGDVGNILAGLYNLASERADTRSWLTLPKDVQLLKTNLSAGEHNVSLNINGLPMNLPVSVEANKINFVFVEKIGQTSHWQSVAL